MVASACHRRVKAMEAAGIIEGYAAILSEKALGRSATIFVAVTLDNQEWMVSADRLESFDRPGGFGPARGIEVVIAADPVSLPLAVRFRQRGDRFRPLGMDHGKKLQDFLVDRKIPREIRDSLPLVVDGDDRIVWVVGESVSEDFRVTEPARGVILLKARRLGGPG